MAMPAYRNSPDLAAEMRGAVGRHTGKSFDWDAFPGSRGFPEPTGRRLGERAARVTEERDDGRPALQSGVWELAGRLARLWRIRGRQRKRRQEGAQVQIRV